MLGITVGYIIIPYALAFLLIFADGLAEPSLTIDAYIGFATTILLAFGLVLEFPIVLVGLARVGILTHRRLASRRRWIIVGIVLFAIVVTPAATRSRP